MTVVAGLFLNDVPALLGDVLITAPGPSNKTFSTPTMGNVNTFFEPQYVHVPALRQKVNILTDKVMVVWAGSYLHARSLVGEMKRELDRTGRPAVAAEVLTSWPEQDIKELSVIVVARGQQQTDIHWYGRMLDLKSKVFKCALLSGSGMEDMARFILRMEEADLILDDRLPDPPKMALYALSLGTQAAGWEYITQENLFNAWGGIVEIGMYNGGKTSKVDEVLYWFWEFDIPSGTLRAHGTFVKQEYQNDLLVTYTLSSEDAPRVVVVPPLLASYGQDARIEVAPPKLTYKWLCSSVVIRDGSKTVDIYSSVERVSDPLPIRFETRRSIPLTGGLISTNTRAIISTKYMRGVEELVGQRATRPGSPETKSKT